MRSDLSLLMGTISNLNLRAYRHGQEAKALARDVGELQALATAVATAAHDPNASIASQTCENRYAHPAHLWREHVLKEPLKLHPAVYRCEGRSTDLT